MMQLVKRALIAFFFLYSAGLFAQSESESVDIWSLSLDEVLNLKVVSAQKTERKLDRIPASVIVITRQEIERQGCMELQDILNMVPGLYLWNGPCAWPNKYRYQRLYKFRQCDYSGQWCEPG